MRGARGVVVFDGSGRDVEHGRLAVRFAPNADTLLERLAAEHRAHEQVLLVTSDTTVASAAGEVAKLSSQTFLRDLDAPRHRDERQRASAASSTTRRGPGSSACGAASRG